VLKLWDLKQGWQGFLFYIHCGCFFTLRLTPFVHRVESFLKILLCFVACDCVKTWCENRAFALSANNGSRQNFNCWYTLQSLFGEGNEVNVDSMKIWPAVLCFSLDGCSWYWQMIFCLWLLLLRLYITVWNSVKCFGMTVWVDPLADKDIMKEINENQLWDNCYAFYCAHEWGSLLQHNIFYSK